ncbi:probable disease resistance protein At5g63020 [Papaver somniferum]|uniref:probable disease resistance protein At5g63020 n=1 Tax=Papaver somniferum TaxID=3469 RepID=UPI000E6FD0CB|nr:probable disease resistance protein At5g63020 [Papaver somniferum]
MDIVSPIFDIFSRLWTCSAHNTDYVRKLKKNLITLESSFHSLRCQRDDVIRRIDMAELNPTQPAKRTNVVSDWLQRVQALETEVHEILANNEAIKNDGGCYFCCWGRKNCWSAYRLGKLVSRKQIVVESLLKEGNIQDVTYRCQPDPHQQIPTVELVGMDAKFNDVLESLVTVGNHVRVVGLYGMGGVGKTTLLQKVNNEFAKRKQFDLVIFVVVSKDLDFKSIQNQMGKKLGVSWEEETNSNERANDIFVLSKNKKLLLLLDDIWEGFDLERIGVSKDTFQITGSKVLFTTRNKQVCGFMEADKSIQIECLDDEQAWSLFQQKVKQEALSCHPDVTEVAKKIAKECCGLPLALIAIGRTMSSKTDLHQWKYALHTLHESASQFSGMADKVLAILKFSYDNLESQKLKSCFLYCSLYPEDHSVLQYELFAVWIGEGFLDNGDDYVKAQNEGHDVIRCLKDACLLESGIALGVKMEYLVKIHDVVRDLAIWVASDLGKKKNTDLTLQSHSIMELHEWEKAERISLVGNKAIHILNGAPNCPNLTTLFLQNSNISDISDEFFRFMPMVKVLNMYCVKLNKLPTSMFSLSNLRSLYMPEFDEDIILAPGNLASLTKMKILCLSESCCHWEVEGGPSLDEVESLRHMICLIITIGTGLALQRLVTSPKFQSCTKFLTIKYCPGITSLTFLPPSLTSPSIVHMSRLNYLSLKNCDDLEELRIISRDEDTLFTALEDLFFSSMPKLRIVWDVPQPSFCSVKLKRVIIRGCPQLKDITWLIYAQNLRELILENLDGLDEILSNGFAAEEKLINTFTKLNYLVLRSLKNLKRLCDQNVKFFLLEKISVVGCPALKKLPFNANSVIPRTLKVEGKKQWWESLEWEDEATKFNLAPYFREI